MVLTSGDWRDRHRVPALPAPPMSGSETRKVPRWPAGLLRRNRRLLRGRRRHRHNRKDHPRRSDIRGRRPHQRRVPFCPDVTDPGTAAWVTGRQLMPNGCLTKNCESRPSETHNTSSRIQFHDPRGRLANYCEKFFNFSITRLTILLHASFGRRSLGWLKSYCEFPDPAAHNSCPAVHTVTKSGRVSNYCENRPRDSASGAGATASPDEPLSRQAIHPPGHSPARPFTRRTAPPDAYSPK